MHLCFGVARLLGRDRTGSIYATCLHVSERPCSPRDPRSFRKPDQPTLETVITSSWPFVLCCKCDSRLVFVPYFTSVQENGPSCPVGDECGPTTGRTGVSSLDSQLMVPFLPRSTFSCTLALAVGGFSGNPPHLRDCVGASLSDYLRHFPACRSKLLADGRCGAARVQ